MNNEQMLQYFEMMKKVFRPHPWHGVDLYSKEDKSELNAYIELVPDDSVKYELHKESGYLIVDRPQKFSNFFPALYGLLPKTYSGDKVAAYTNELLGRTDLVGDCDPTDICVLTEKHIAHGDLLVNCIPIGGFRMIDGGEVDDKIVAVLKDDALYGHIKDVKDCPESILNRLKHYFLTYKEIPTGTKSAKVEITHLYGAEEAKKIIALSEEDYSDKYDLEYLKKKVNFHL